MQKTYRNGFDPGASFHARQMAQRRHADRLLWCAMMVTLVVLMYSGWQLALHGTSLGYLLNAFVHQGS